jgi:hypothetical protein
MAKKTQLSSDEKIELGKEATGFSNLLLGGGVVLLLAGVGLGLSDTENLFRSYVVGFMYVLSIALGLLWFVIINHLVNAKWVIVVRRVAEILVSQMPVLFVLALGILIPMALVDVHSSEMSPLQHMYVWLHENTVLADHLLHHKAPYLNKGFFLARMVGYFVFWGALSVFFLRKSLEQDKTTSKAESQAIVAQLGKVSAPAMIAFALTLTFCAFDMLMSLSATWFSTIFGVYYFAGCILSGYSMLALALMWVQSTGRLRNYVNANHYHDLGKMMFAFIIFWSYIGFSQFMLIWYGDVPEETFWFKRRFMGDWRTVSTLLLVCHFALPFLGLLSRHVKRNKKTLAFWAVWLLAVHFVDIFWIVFPKDESGHMPLALSAPLFAIGGLALFLGMAARRAKGINLVPTKDPRLPQSLAFENY